MPEDILWRALLRHRKTGETRIYSLRASSEGDLLEKISRDPALLVWELARDQYGHPRIVREKVT